MIYIYHSKKWNPAEVKDLRQGDFFKKTLESEVYHIAARSAYQKEDGKWSVDLEDLK